MTEPYQPRYQWRRTELDANDPPTDFDWLGFDGIGYIGRIRKEAGGPTAGRWNWAGSVPRTFKGSPPTPNQGYCDTAREATEMVETYWDWCLARMCPRK
ncbi:hypothetical protein [Ensifer adhaerens]|uniref:hypothetical protein n=1 Tax=Ensifer adhaerens TaxID=106592 RepID=UPI00098EAE72|nr:hypothetical protein [Ensifer adhaerens]